MTLVPEVDDDGYPTEATEEVVQKWACIGKENKLALMDYVKKAWWMASWGWSEEDFEEGKRYQISTGGWSGNESLISALRGNFIFWSLSWVQSRRGGHYIFEVTR